MIFQSLHCIEISYLVIFSPRNALIICNLVIKSGALTFFGRLGIFSMLLNIFFLNMFFGSNRVDHWKNAGLAPTRPPFYYLALQKEVRYDVWCERDIL